MRRLAAAVIASGCLLAAGCTGGASTPSAPSRSPTHPAASHPALSSPAPQPALIARVVRVHTSQGYQLRVSPTAFGRNWTWREPTRALSQVLRLVGRLPVRLTPSMRRSLRNQLECHGAFAMRKRTWDIETWRPDVGYARTVGALCNPN